MSYPAQRLVVGVHREYAAEDAIAQFGEAIRASGLVPPEVIYADGKLHRFASGGTRGDKAGWYILFLDGNPAGRFGCWRTGVDETWRSDIGVPLTGADKEDQRTKVTSARQAAELERTKVRAEAAKAALRIWNTAGPVVGTPVEIYLRRRGIVIVPPCTLRCGTLNHGLGGRWPAMVALVTNGDSTPMAIHRTFLAQDGSGKAPVEPQKMMLGPCRGGAVRLGPVAIG